MCERGIDCIECNSRAMCNSYAAFKYEQGRADAIEEFLHLMSKLSEYARPVGWSKKVEIIPMSIVRSIAEEIKEGRE